MFTPNVRLPILLAGFLTAGQALVSEAAIPLAPTNLTAAASSETSIVLTWTDNSTNENQFRIERSSNPSTGFVQIAKTKANVRTYTNNGLLPATGYYYRVYAFRRSNPPSPYTNVAFATTLGRDSISPTVPTGLSATVVSCSRIDLRWNLASDTGSGVAGYEISRDGSVIAHTTAATYSDASRPASTGFSYNVAAFDNAGNYSAMSPPVAAATPSCTTNQAPTANAGPDRSTPTLASLVFSGAASFDADGSVVSWSWSFGDGSTGSGASVNHLWSTPGTYNVVLTVTDNAGASATDSASVVVTNRAPTANAGADQSGTTGAALSFNGSASSDMDGSIASYSWAFGDGGTASGMSVSHVFANPGSYTVTLTTTDNLGAQDSDVAMAGVTAAVTIPNPPSGLGATAISSSRIDLAWSDNSSNETGFRIERAASQAGPFSQIGTATAASFSDASAPVASTSYYRVSAYNTAGTSAPSSVAGATTPGNPPAAPSSLSASGVSPSQINLSWIDSSSNETSFKIERASAASGPWTQVATMGVNTTAWSNTGLAASTTWYYRVKASNTAGDSAPSPTASATTQAAAPVLPAAPSNLTAAATSASQISLGWTDNATSETGFKVERATVSTGPFTQVATPGANATSYNDSGLAAGTAYFYRVRATSGAGDSGYSNTANATTQSGSTDTSAPSVPAGVVTTPPSCGGIQIDWSASSDTGGSGLRGYKIYRKSTYVTEVSASTLSFLDTGLPPAAYYYYYISSIDNAGNESAKSAAIGTYTLSCVGSGGDYDWDRHTGGNIMPDEGLAIVADAAGSTYVTGDFSLSAAFGQSTLNSAGSRDVFVAKYAESGSLLWAKRFGGAYDDFGQGIAVDDSGNVFVTGKFQASADLGGGLTSAGGYDIFLAKLRGNDGAVLWAKRFGGTGADEAAALALDSNGDVVITGQFFGTVDFGGGSVTNASSYVQAFVAKYSGANGAHLWSKRLGKLLATAPTSVGSGRGVSVDPSNNVVIAGYFGGPVDFGGGVLTSAGAMDVFVAKYAGADGRWLWARRYGDANDQHANAVATDSSGNVIVTGDFLSAINFGGGALTPSPGTQTIFLAKLAAGDGGELWANSFVAAGLNVGSYGWAVATDGANNILMTGQMSGPVDLGGGPLNNVGGVFTAKYGPTGVHLWSKNFRGGGGQGRAIAVGLGGETVMTGSFDTVQDFGGGEVRSGGNTGSDLFILCLGH